MQMRRKVNHEIPRTNGEKIVYNDFGGLGEAYYYNAKGHCYMSVID